MKQYLLCVLLALSALMAGAQSVSELPAGIYETKTKDPATRWERGDLILLDDSRYKLSGSEQVGEYRFSVAAQRLFFTSGPLKSAFTKVALRNGKPVIILPPEENNGLGLKAEILASKQ